MDVAAWGVVISAAVAAAVTVLVKSIDTVSAKASRHEDMAVQIRDELRKELLTLRDQLDKNEAEANDWRIKYFDMVEVLATWKAKAVALQAEIEKLRSEIVDLRQHVGLLRDARCKLPSEIEAA